MNPQTHIWIWSRMESPIGPLTLGCTQKGVCALSFGSGDAIIAQLKAWGKRWFRSITIEENEQELQLVAEQLQTYFNSTRRSFDVPLDLYGTPFQKRVWEVLETIPYGESRSYKEIAQAIGSPKAVRAVGGANNKNPIPIIIPCHRVIGHSGSLVGYGGGLEKKKVLLELEGLLSPSSSVT
ncbi:methylated-DNA--[protein]-cysteine S-methyltransferase [Mechercharimyces sp. CAU 1602]|uniref:methylated-DNA--[protein]-cysteine S-methyltransferase n=1 Tax=Mechercharimyces sp. CAU 1602 TaxID=2973933 RepID=UPI002161A912|nr:methylated-DNA--[protein]-cysteine S-methyltransferase [Mechercharimyces sp. CAU 1602]MCS1351712.1 methylated-DNA--[protein]-cysteine S-methyltransferase [Mechercharimyces sp. CAU 1602]